MRKTQLLNTIAWLFLLIGIMLLLWYIFGKSPSELYVILPFIFMLTFKVWSISDNLSGLKSEFKEYKNKFHALANDFKEHIKKR